MFFFQIISSQNKYDFFGAIKLNGSDKSLITYRIVFEEKNGNINGFSVTDLDGAHETKNVISGSYDRKSKILSFKEDAILYTKSKFSQSSFCFVNFTGKVKLVQNTSKIEGAFKGLYNNKTQCIDGTLTLVGSNKIYKLAEKVNKKIQSSNKIDIKVKEKNNPIALLDSLKINKLSKDQNLSVFWDSKEVKIEIFDSGKEDGDRINLYHNDKLILNNYKVEYKKKTITVVLDLTTTNEIKILALNEGEIASNTSKIILHDVDRTFEILTTIKKNESALITFIKNNPKK